MLMLLAACEQIANAEEALKAETNADVVRDVRVQLQPLRRRARLVYFPAYIVQYTFGEVLAETGERRPQHFMAVISGMGASQCAHISSRNWQCAGLHRGGPPATLVALDNRQALQLQSRTWGSPK
jgi:hypothetical protein